MAATIKDSVYKAIDVIVGKRIEDLHLDKTIEATVEQCLSLSAKKYRLRYGSGIFDAYAINDDVYVPNTAVYVLIPENDFNKRKTILGKANTGSQTNTLEEQNIASMYSGYSIIGQNILTCDNTNQFNLASYSSTIGEDSILLYDADQPNNKNKIEVNNEKLKIYLEEAKGFIFSGKFKTNFSSSQVLTGREDYGLIFNIALRNGKTSFENIQARWDIQEPKTINSIIEDDTEIITRLNDYKDKIETIFSENNTVQIIQDKLYKQQVKLLAYASELDFVDSDTLELVNLYIQLINDLVNCDTNIHGDPITAAELYEQYKEWFASTSYAFQEEEYSVLLNTSNMTGNVYHYAIPTYQYTFAEIDAERFVRVNSIYFYYKNFKYKPELTAIGDDIQVSDVSITCIKYLDNINGDYRLDLEYEDIYFGINSSNKDTLDITAKLIYKDTTDVTNYSQIMWFRQNSNITSEDIGYSMYGGQGWEHITTNNTYYNRSPVLTITAEENKAYRNKYKVVGMYESGTIVQQEFIIYNEKNKHNIELVSDSGLYFGEGSGKKKITCLIDGESNVSDDYQFTWYKETDDGVRYKILTLSEINQQKEELSLLTPLQKTEQQTILNAIENIELDINELDNYNNYIYVNATAISGRNKIKIICMVSTKTSHTYLGEVDLTLSSGSSKNLKSYYIEIINGNQVFQYNEAGIAPSSTIYEDPLVPQPLSCNFYDPNGGLIDPLKYTISWEIPITNSLINTNTNLLSYNPATEENNILKSSICEFVIQNEYNYNYTNNQIICIVEFNDGDGLVTYRQPTNFFFGKIGDDGTNGTDIVAKIDVINNKHSDAESDYNNNTLVNELLTLKIEEQINTNNEKSYSSYWNNGLNTNDPILQLQLYRKNNLIDYSEYRKVNWSILNNGLISKYWRTQNTQNSDTGAKQAILLYDIEKNNNDKAYTNYIIKAQADLPIDENKFQTYYNFYPICTDTKYQIEPHDYVIKEYDDNGNPMRGSITKTVFNNYNVGIDRTRTLRQVVYNSDGRNPLYDKNLGVGLTFKNLDYPRTIVWEPHGGIILDNKKDEVFPAFTIGKNVSYVVNHDDTVENIIADLEFRYEQELEAKYQEQQTDIGITIYNSILSELDILQLQIDDIQSQYDNLVNSRITQWEEFCEQQQLNINSMFTKLYNLIDKNVENDNWIFEDYIYLNGEQYYSAANAFQQDIFVNYLEAKFKFDDIDHDYIVNVDALNKIETILNQLDFIIDLEDETEKEKIEQSFVTLINLLIVGYQAYKIVYDRKIKTLNDDIDELKETLDNLLNQETDYNTARNLVRTMLNNPSSSAIWNQILDILFNDSSNYESLDEILLTVVLSLKTQFINEIVTIKEKYDNQIAFLSGVITNDNDPTYCSITPNEVYNGEYANQYVKVKIYQGLLDEPNNKFLEHELIIPFHMSLNTYGLASLNAWDGNSIEINEDEGYVLAPQIGAGIKHVEDNTFTGVLMGTERTYDDAEGQEEIGLLGYSHGKRSIFLDASTGNATFGLPETDAADMSNPLTEGRIELRPGGTSSISKWNFDSRSIYRVSTGDEEEALLQTKAYTKQLSATSLGAPYEDAPQYAHGSIPHTKQGILLSALPAYASFKGRILTEQDQSDERVNFLNLNTTVREGDTFELQIDPNDSRFFSLYEHSARIYEGSGTCDTLNGYRDTNKYSMTTDEFNQYFTIFVDRSDINYQNVNANKDIILTQRYIQTTGTKSKQIFRPLSYIYERDGQKYWKLINTTVDKRGRETNEYVIGILKQYRDWQNDNTKQQIWTYITFIPQNDIDEVPLKSIYNDDDELIGLVLLNNKIINDDTKVWHRYKKAGIDATGKFVSEGVGTGAVGLGLNDIQAFDLGSLFIGANFESNNGNIIQFFIDKLSNVPTAPVFVSSTKILGTSNNDEGRRPIRVYAGQDYEDLSTGIFVGKNAQKNPSDTIAKIELSQTSIHDNSIILSALGNTPNNNKSILTLSSATKDQIGGLTHTGKWNTDITGDLTITAGNQIFMESKNAVTVTIANNFTSYFNSKKNTVTITNNEFRLKHNTDNLLVLRESTATDTDPHRGMSWLSGKKGVRIVGGYRTDSQDKNVVSDYGLLFEARRTSKGAVLSASNGTTFIKSDQGDAYLLLQPASSGTPAGARFQLYAGKHSYVYSHSKLNNTSGTNGVIIGPNLEIGSADGTTGTLYVKNINASNNITGKTFNGDGTHITNTCYYNKDKRTSHHQDATTKKWFYDTDKITHSSSSDKSGTTHTIKWEMPGINITNGRPSIGDHSGNFSFTIPKVDLTNYATKNYVDSKLKNWVTRTELDQVLRNYTSASKFNQHYHDSYDIDKDGKMNTRATTGPKQSSR